VVQASTASARDLMRLLTRLYPFASSINSSRSRLPSMCGTRARSPTMICRPHAGERSRWPQTEHWLASTESGSRHVRAAGTATSETPSKEIPNASTIWNARRGGATRAHGICSSETRSERRLSSRSSVVGVVLLAKNNDGRHQGHSPAKANRLDGHTLAPSRVSRRGLWHPCQSVILPPRQPPDDPRPVTSATRTSIPAAPTTRPGIHQRRCAHGLLPRRP
jgi:hypothetical protein